MSVRGVVFVLVSSFLFSTSPRAAIGDGCGSGLDDGDQILIRKLKMGGFFLPTARQFEIVDGSVTLQGNHYVWSLKASTGEARTESESKIVSARIVRGVSNYPVVVLDAGDDPKVLLPVRGNRVSWVSVDDNIKMIPTDDLRWEPMFRRGEPGQEWRYPSHYKASLDGVAVTVDIAPPGRDWIVRERHGDRFELGVPEGALLEFEDGRRYRRTIFMQQISPAGIGPILATIARSPGVRALLSMIHRQITERSMDPKFPLVDEIQDALFTTAYSASRGSLSAILGPSHGPGRERWVILVNGAQQTIARPSSKYAESVRLRTGHNVRVRDGAWYVVEDSDDRDGLGGSPSPRRGLPPAVAAAIARARARHQEK